MKLLTDWGFRRETWQQGERGEYWVLAQAILLLILPFLPIQPLPGIPLTLSLQWGLWTLAGLLGGFAVMLVLNGLLALGKSLTPLPYPREDGQLVQTGVYGIVRHPIYSGVILAILAWAIAHLSWPHFLATLVFFLFFNAKASREERWLTEKYPDYPSYQQQTKKLIPLLY
ncbi:MAG TPA: isoprenylcysteine carboxylmethyltransferase family protein [Synechococcales cyanobacterium M55_K2018_004]|nr:isoprenylcysteine carboxylmethyltransferase family protein [Synechococcales cyanobacterium M55_K2018_004]